MLSKQNTERCFVTVISTKYSFFKHKKDQCSICERYNRAKETGNVDKTLLKDYDDHQSMKVQAREEKEKDRKKSQEDSKYYV